MVGLTGIASMAGLVDNNAMVSVGPPLFCNVPRSGLAPTIFPREPLVSPPEPPVPMRLLELCASPLAKAWSSVPVMSLAVLCAESVLVATIVL